VLDTHVSNYNIFVQTFQRPVYEPLDPPWLNIISKEAGMTEDDYYKEWETEYPEVPKDYFYRIPKVLGQNQRRFFSNIPRTIITPDGMYWAPLLRKDFPFDFPGRRFNMPKDHSYVRSRKSVERRLFRQDIVINNAETESEKELRRQNLRVS